jgi:DNA-binding protein HU-beta
LGVAIEFNENMCNSRLGTDSTTGEKYMTTKKSKADLVQAVAEAANLKKTEATAAVDAVLAEVTRTLAAGGELTIPGFGKFSVSRREASKGRNPSTGAEIDVPARTVAKFSAGKALKDAVNA